MLRSGLLIDDQLQRLGNVRSGAEGVRRHKWFGSRLGVPAVSWGALLSRDIEAPYVPEGVWGASDASQFDSVPEPMIGSAYGHDKDVLQEGLLDVYDNRQQLDALRDAFQGCAGVGDEGE